MAINALAYYKGIIIWARLKFYLKPHLKFNFVMDGDIIHADVGDLGLHFPCHVNRALIDRDQQKTAPLIKAQRI